MLTYHETLRAGGVKSLLTFSKSLSAQADKTTIKIVLTKSKDKFHHDKFLFCLLHPPKKFQSRKIPSVLDLFIRRASLVAKRFNLQFPGLILCRFKIYNPRVLQQKTIFAFPINWFQFNYLLVVSCTITDGKAYHGFVYLVDFAKFLPRANFVGGALKDLPTSAKMC